MFKDFIRQYLNGFAVRESSALRSPLFDLCAIASSSCQPLLIIIFVTVLTLFDTAPNLFMALIHQQ